jgi:cytoskeleton protein RodZ
VRVLERLNSPKVLVVALTVFLVLNGLLLYWYQQSLRSTEGGVSNAPVEEGTSPLGAGSTTARETTMTQRERPTTVDDCPKEEEREAGLRVLVEVGNVGFEGVELSVAEDGQLVCNKVAGSGLSQVFQAEEAVTLTSSDAGAVRVQVNGEDLGPLGAPGEPVTRTFVAPAEM